MSDMELKRQDASRLINNALPYLSVEQTVAYANAIAGAATTNQMVEQMRNSEPPRLLPELMNISTAGASV